MVRKIGDLIIAGEGSIWKFDNTPLIYLGYVRGDISSIADGRAMHFFYGKENRRISIREKVIDRIEINLNKKSQ